MPSLTAVQAWRLDEAVRRAALATRSLTEVAARFAIAAGAAPSRELEAVLDSVTALLGEAAAQHLTKGSCLACTPGESCPLVGVADAFLPEGMVTR